MPKFEVYNDEYNGTSDLTVKASKGDLRLVNGCNLEQMDEYNSWNHICNIQYIDTEITNHSVRLGNLEAWKQEEDAKEQDAYKDLDLESKYKDLKEAGDSLRKLEEECKQARTYMRRMEKALGLARDSYRELLKYTNEKQKTFDTLDQDWPEKDNTTKEPT